MIVSVLKMAETTIGVLAFCIMGVMGGITDVDTSGQYMVARTSWQINVALPPVAYVTEYYGDGARFQDVRSHEAGHLVQADILSGLYYLVIAVPSVTWNVFGDYNGIDEYRAHWVEAWADYEGGLR